MCLKIGRFSRMCNIPLPLTVVNSLLLSIKRLVLQRKLQHTKRRWLWLASSWTYLFLTLWHYQQWHTQSPDWDFEAAVRTGKISWNSSFHWVVFLELVLCSISHTLADIQFLKKKIFWWDFQVKKRTSNDNSYYGSHVMQYGDVKLNVETLFLYMGTNPANDNFTYIDENSLSPSSKTVNQRDADLLHFWHKVCTLINQLSRTMFRWICWIDYLHVLMSSTCQDNLYIRTCSSVRLLKVLIGKLKLRASLLKLWHTEHTLITALLWLGSFSSELRRAPKSWTPFSLLASLSSKTGTASNPWYVLMFMFKHVKSTTKNHPSLIQND